MLPGVFCDVSEAPDHPDLQVVRKVGSIRKSRKTYLLHGVTPGGKYLAYNPTIDAAERALKERLFFIRENERWIEPPVATRAKIMGTLKVFGKLLKGLSKKQHPLEHSEFAECYHGPRKTRYLKAAEDLARDPVKREDAHIKFFLKFETYDFETKIPSPRGINPRSDRYAVSLGSYIRPIEKRIYKNISRVFGYRVVLKGMNQAARGEIISSYWNEFVNPVAIPIDASRFEQSVDEAILEWEHSIYQSFYLGDGKLAKMLRWQRLNIGRCYLEDGKLKFKIRGKRMSGDVNTALGNCLISAACGHAYLSHANILKHRFFCDGDDAVLIIERSDLLRVQRTLKPWYAELSFRMKVEKPVFILEELDFCQSRPVYTTEGYIMVRVPYRALSKDAVSKKPLDNHRVYRRWMRAVGEGGMSLSGGIPVMQAYYKAILDAAGDIKPLQNDPVQRDFTAYKLIGMNRKYAPVQERVRASFCLAFGIDPASQRVIERYYETLKLVYGVDGCSLVHHGNLPW